jgi:uncharacterized damage-inducible protein DinB
MTLNASRPLLRYNDRANDEVLRAAGGVPDAALDRLFEMGVGSLRRTLIHIYNGEHVWLSRWRAQAETKWPPEDEPTPIAELAGRFEAHRRARDAYLATLPEAALAEVVTYRDSKGALYKAQRGDMLLQACVHSIHHRAQAANMLRRLGAGLVELDYMMSLRQPV